MNLIKWIFASTKIKFITKKIVLYMSECDGMCEHCNEEIKELCKEQKKCL